jgi:hypothetical protein
MLANRKRAGIQGKKKENTLYRQASDFIKD